nr:glutathione binding-like protein [Parachlamydia acanthamoebae]
MKSSTLIFVPATRIPPNSGVSTPMVKSPRLSIRLAPAVNPLRYLNPGAILIYLAEKTGQFLSKDPHQRYATLQWLMFQMGGFGPILGQAHHFIRFAPERIPYAMDRYRNESKRLYGVLNGALADRDYIAGDYSIADMALYPWALSHDMHEVDLAPFPHIAAWIARISQRPAIAPALEKA